MTAASTTAAAMAAARRFAGGSGRAGGGKGGEFLRELFRAAMGAFGIFPVAGADEQFAVLPAFFTMKLIYRHDSKSNRLHRKDKGLCHEFRDFPGQPFCLNFVHDTAATGD